MKMRSGVPRRISDHDQTGPLIFASLAIGGSSLGPAPGAVAITFAQSNSIPRIALYGSRTAPVRYASQLRAAARPSAIAHTISDAPRTASPAAKTPDVVQANASSTAMVPELSKVTESPASKLDRVGPS